MDVGGRRRGQTRQGDVAVVLGHRHGHCGCWSLILQLVAVVVLLEASHSGGGGWTHGGGGGCDVSGYIVTIVCCLWLK